MSITTQIVTPSNKTGIEIVFTLKKHSETQTQNKLHNVPLHFCYFSSVCPILKAIVINKQSNLTTCRLKLKSNTKSYLHSFPVIDNKIKNIICVPNINLT